MGEPEATANRRGRKKWVTIVVIIVLVYLLVAYLILPAGWLRYEKRHPSFAQAERLTETGDHHPGDPVNVAIVGTEDELKKAILAAGWHPADALSLKSSLEIAEASVLKKQYEDAPVSNLFLFGRKEDLAFEQPVGDNPRKRHHVRFWKWNQTAPDGEPVWFGSATYDERVGLSHTTGQVTHHIDGDVDAERDHLLQDLQHTGDVAEVYVVKQFHKILEGRNGGGDLWHTDGDLWVGVLKTSDLGPPSAP